MAESIKTTITTTSRNHRSAGDLLLIVVLIGNEMRNSQPYREPGREPDRVRVGSRQGFRGGVQNEWVLDALFSIGVAATLKGSGIFSRGWKQSGGTKGVG